MEIRTDEGFENMFRKIFDTALAFEADTPKMIINYHMVQANGRLTELDVGQEGWLFNKTNFFTVLYDDKNYYVVRTSFIRDYVSKVCAEKKFIDPGPITENWLIKAEGTIKTFVVSENIKGLSDFVIKRSGIKT